MLVNSETLQKPIKLNKITYFHCLTFLKPIFKIIPSKRTIDEDFTDWICALPEQMCTIKTSDRSQMNPNKFLFKTALSAQRGEEGQPHQSLVRTTFSSFSRPNHVEILVLSILFFLKCPILENKYIFKNMATLGHKTWPE